MKKTLSTLLFALTLSLASGAHAATTVLWQDADTGIKMAYPEDWMRQPQLEKDLRLSILAPQGADHAACRLYVNEDGRFKHLAPAQYPALNAQLFTQDAVRAEIAKRRDLDNVVVTNYQSSAPFGKSTVAAVAELNFDKTWAGRIYPMHAMVLATQYYGTKVIVSCETLAIGWQTWLPLIQRMLHEVELPNAFTKYPQGYYRPFPYEGQVYYTRTPSIFMPRVKSAAPNAN